MDYFIVIEPGELKYSFFWRLEAEQKTYQRTGFGMADEQVESMVCYYWKCLHPKIFVIFYSI
jgi:pantothenate kinase-related protein Tda10